MMKRLDVGCGEDPTGTVNFDVRKMPASSFVRGDAHLLPFRDNAFETVYSRALLEHLDNPIRALKEMIRVSSFHIVVIVPHRCFDSGLPGLQRRGKHIQHFSYLTVKHILQKLGYSGSRIEIVYEHFPKFFPIVKLPWLIKVELFKQSTF